MLSGEAQTTHAQDAFRTPPETVDVEHALPTMQAAASEASEDDASLAAPSLVDPSVTAPSSVDPSPVLPSVPVEPSSPEPSLPDASPEASPAASGPPSRMRRVRRRVDRGLRRAVAARVRGPIPQRTVARARVARPIVHRGVRGGSVVATPFVVDAGGRPTARAEGCERADSEDDPPPRTKLYYGSLSLAVFGEGRARDEGAHVVPHGVGEWVKHATPETSSALFAHWQHGLGNSDRKHARPVTHSCAARGQSRHAGSSRFTGVECATSASKRASNARARPSFSTTSKSSLSQYEAVTSTFALPTVQHVPSATSTLACTWGCTTPSSGAQPGTSLRAKTCTSPPASTIGSVRECTSSVAAFRAVAHGPRNGWPSYVGVA